MLLLALRLPVQSSTHVPASIEELRVDAREFVFVVITCVLAWLVVRLVASRIERIARLGHSEEWGPGREQRARTLAQMLRNSGQTVVLIVGIIMALQAFGIQTTALLGAAGMFGLAISFGAQNRGRDYVTRFFLQIELQGG